MADLTLAASQKSFERIFAAVRDNIRPNTSGTKDMGAFSVTWDVQAHLEKGTIDLRSDNTLSIKELDIRWDNLSVDLGLDIPSICVGGFCIIPSPFGGCILRAPRICVFEGDPDIHLPLSLGNLITSEISMTASLVTKYFVNPNRPAGMNAWDAQDHIPPLYDEWRIHLDPHTIDVDLIDIADTVGNLLTQAAEAAIDGILSFLPGWARSIIKAILGPIIDLISGILDIVDDIGEWLSDLLGVSIGLFNLVAQFVADAFASDYPLFRLENPFPMLRAANNPNPTGPSKLIPVKIPISDLSVNITDAEMVLAVNAG